MFQNSISQNTKCAEFNITLFTCIPYTFLKVVRADPVCSRNLTGTLLIMGTTEKEEPGLTIEIIRLT